MTKSKNDRGLCQDRIAHLRAVIEADVSAGLYYGAAIRVSRSNTVGLDATVGYEDGERKRPLKPDAVFSIFSTTKAFINVLTLRAIEMGRYALTTRLSDIIPEFTGAPRDKVTFFHLLTHTTGMPSVWVPKPDMYQGRHAEMFAAVIEYVHGNVEPGTRCDYAPASNHILMAEALLRTDPSGRDLRTILAQDLFEPLGMNDTSLGVRKDLKARHVKPDMRGTLPIKLPGRTIEGPYAVFEEEDTDMAHVGCISTVDNIWRFTEMLRCGGTLDESRILSPRMIALARKNWTGRLPNEIYHTVALRAGWEPPPAFMGLGFNVRGEGIVHHQLGTLTSPETFGNYGAGSSVYWVDPELDMSFACLTAGVMKQAPNIERFQKLADIAVSAAI